MLGFQGIRKVINYDTCKFVDILIHVFIVHFQSDQVAESTVIQEPTWKKKGMPTGAQKEVWINWVRPMTKQTFQIKSISLRSSPVEQMNTPRSLQEVGFWVHKSPHFILALVVA